MTDHYQTAATKGHVMPDLKDRLRQDGSAFGCMVMEFLVPGMPAIIAATGADFALFDMEHTGASLETMKAMVAGCRGIGLAPLVRVPRGEYHFIARALDIGAHGVMVPMVELRRRGGPHRRLCALSAGRPTRCGVRRGA